MKLSKDIKIGTKVKIGGFDGWFKVKEIIIGALDIDWVKLEGLAGSFQAGHLTDCFLEDDEEAA